MKNNFLRTKYPRFVFHDFEIKFLKKNSLKIVFDFRIEPQIYFRPIVIIKGPQLKKFNDKIIRNLAFHLGLIESLSYWKATCSSEIVVKAGYLNREQIEWWKKLILKGMGQFFYENKIDFRKPDFIKIVVDVKNSSLTKLNTECKEQLNAKKILLPIGGGKDSIVALKVLKGIDIPKKELFCFSLNPHAKIQAIFKKADCKNSITIKRKVDHKLLELNQQGFLNGHTPFTAYLSFISVFISYLFDIKYIVFSNERSANQGNVKYLDKMINHQWSKTFEFEKMFQEYAKKYLIKDIKYFSLLRPLYEIQISQLFSLSPEYFPLFVSCNKIFKQSCSKMSSEFSNTAHQKFFKAKLHHRGLWCGHCPKCLFVFVALYPFLKQENLMKIFNQNLFEKKELLLLMQQLIGKRGFKPFECVGTNRESLIALYLSWRKEKGKEPFSLKLPFLLKYFESNLLSESSNLRQSSKKILKDWNKNNLLPKKFEKALKNYQKTLSK